MEWTARWGRGKTKERAIVLACAGMAAAGGIVLVQSVFAAVLGAVAVVATCAELFFPVHCRLDAEGASTRCGLNKSVIRWAEVKRLIPVEGGVRLSPLAEPGWMDTFRGVVLRFVRNEDEVLGKIGELWDSDAELLAERDRPGA